MTVTTTTAATTPVTGNGSTTSFTVTFQYWEKDELLVYLRTIATGAQVLQNDPTHYTASGGQGSTGAVNFVTPPASTVEVHIIRNTERDQPEDLTPAQVVPSAALERGLDRSVMLDQEDALQVSKALRAPITDSSGLDMELPSSVARASKVLGFDSAGEPVATTQADQSALTVVATGSTEARTHAERWGEVFNVKDYGATGDGVVDDTAAMQSAMTAAGVSGGTVYWPDGDYKFTAALSVGSDTKLLCEKGALLKTSVSDIHFIVNDDTSGGNTNIVLDGVNIDGVGVTGGTTSKGVNLQNITGLTVRDCRFVNFPRHALHLNDIDEFEVVNNEFDSPGRIVQYVREGGVPEGSAIYSEFVRRGLIQANRMRDPWQMAIFIWGSTSGESYEISITGNQIEGCNDNGIRLQPATSASVDFDNNVVRSIAIASNVIIDTSGDGIRVNGRNVSIVGNVITTRALSSTGSPSCINSGGVEECVIANNVLTDWDTEEIAYGIRIRPDDSTNQAAAIKHLVISGNAIHGFYGGGIIISGAGSTNEVIEDIVVSGNTINGSSSTATQSCISVSNGTSSRIKISGNICHTEAGGVSTHGIQVFGAIDVTVSDNTCYNNAARGINLGDVTNFIVSNNRCFDDRTPKLQAHGLNVDDTCDEGIIIGNDFTGNLNGGIRNGGTGATNVTQCIGNRPVEPSALVSFTLGGTGQAITRHLTNSASLNFGSTAAQSSSDLTISVSGSADGDTVCLGVPNSAVNANTAYTAWVSASNTVTVRFSNYSSGAIDPASATFRVDVWKH